MQPLNGRTPVLLIVGASGLDVVAAIFGAGTLLARFVCILVGLSAMVQIATAKRQMPALVV